MKYTPRPRAIAKLVLMLGSAIVIATGCSEQGAPGALTPSRIAEIHDSMKAKYGRVLEHGVQPLLRKNQIKGGSHSTDALYEAVALLDRFLADCQAIMSQHPDTELAKKVQEARDKAEDALEKILHEQPDGDDAYKKVSEATEKIVKGVEEGKIDGHTGEMLIKQLLRIESVLTGTVKSTVPLLQVFLSTCEQIMLANPDTELAKKVEEVRREAEAALEKMLKVPADTKGALDEIDDAFDKLSKAVHDSKIGSKIGDFLRERLRNIEKMITGVSHDSCRGTKRKVWVERHGGGLVQHCGHEIKVPDKALKKSSDMYVHVLDKDEVIVDFGSDGWFEKEVEIKLNIEDVDLSGVDSDNVVLAWLDEQTGTWYGVETKIDLNKKKLIAKVWHFTRYTLSAD